MDDTPLYSGTPPPVAPPSSPPVSTSEPLNPWFSIWVSPRATMRQILATDPRRLVHLLATVAGAGGAFQSLQMPDAVVDAVGLYPLVVLKLFVGAAVGLIILYLFGFLVRLTGSWLGGTGNFVAIRAALAWSTVPNIWSTLLWLPVLVFLGEDAFNLNIESQLETPGALFLIVPLVVISAVVSVWSVIILMNCLAEAHGFVSAWQGFGAYFNAVLIIMAAVLIITLPFILLAVSFAGLVG